MPGCCRFLISADLVKIRLAMVKIGEVMNVCVPGFTLHDVTGNAM